MRTRRAVLSLALAAAIFCFHDVSPARSEAPAIVRKLNAYVACINRLSERAYQSRERYFSWVGKKGPTGKERIIYGTYTIYETDNCERGVKEVAELEPRDPELEAAGAAYVTAVVALAPLLKEADDYYKQQDYKDDGMARGRTLHPRLVSAWGAFADADQKLCKRLDALQEQRSVEQLAEIERTEGRKQAYHVQTVMLGAKRLVRIQTVAKPDVPAVAAALAEYDSTIRAAEEYAASDKTSRIGTDLLVSAKQLLVTSKQLMRRQRDKTPYSKGDQLLLNAGGGAMVEGSPGRLTRDYNELIQSFNRMVR